MAQKNGGPAQKQAAPRTDERQKPAFEFRLGRIRATVWENHHEKTGRWFSVQVTRTYKDADGKWQNATTFGRDDLFVVAEVVRQARLWIGQAERKDGRADANGEPAGDDVPF